MLSLFIVAIIVPATALSLIIATVSDSLFSSITTRLTDSIISALCLNIGIYQEELDRLTIIPYYDEKILYAIKLKSSGAYETASDYNRLVADRALENKLTGYIQNTRDDIRGFSILMPNGIVFRTARGEYAYTRREPDLLESEWYRIALEAEGRAVFLGHESHLDAPDPIVYPEGTHVFSVARVINDPDTREPLAVICADADTGIFRDFVSSLDFTLPATVLITDGRGRLVYADGEAEKFGSDMAARLESSGDAGRRRYERVTSKIDLSGWEITVLLSRSDLYKRVLWIYALALSFITLGLVTAASVYRRLTRTIVLPLQAMAEAMHLVEKGDLSARAETSGTTSSELMDLATTFNHMTISLKEHIDREYVAALKQQTAQYQALQSQIKPHFLYNTLNGILSLNRIGEKGKVDHAIRDLTGLLRYIQQTETVTTIAEEFRFIDLYCRLQKLRFPKKLSYKVECADSIGALEIPRLLIQPFVENAIIHGIEPVARDCRLAATAVFGEEEQAAIIRISDDGKGFAVDQVDIRESIGCDNSLSRLQMTHPGSRLFIMSEPGRGTTVEMMIPADEGLG